MFCSPAGGGSDNTSRIKATAIATAAMPPIIANELFTSDIQYEVTFLSLMQLISMDLCNIVTTYVTLVLRSWAHTKFALQARGTLVRP